MVWARDEADGQVKGFLVEKGTPGYDARRSRARARCGPSGRPTSRLDDVRVPEDEPAARAPNSFKDTGRVLAGTRNAVRLGGARPRHRRLRGRAHLLASSAPSSASRWCSFQIVQDRLVKMLAEVSAMQLYCLRLGRLTEAGR